MTHLSCRRLLSVLALAVVSLPSIAGDRLLATGGAVSIEATAGGGITPWAVLAGYGTDSQFGCAGAASAVSTSDYGFSSLGFACSWNNRVEISVGRQQLDLDTLRPLLGLADDQMLRQRFVGAKVRLHGDIVYSRFGQWSGGLVYKDNEDAWLARLAGADRSSDLEFYLSAGKLFLDGLFGRYTYLNATVRSSGAHQTGLLGFAESHETLLEFTAAVFPRRDVAVGIEYRQKPDGLAFAKEDDWVDLFVAWFPSKHMNIVAAWVDLGSIATLDDQAGPYLSVAGSF